MTNFTKPALTLASLSALVLLAACGGGSSDGLVPDPAASPFEFDATPSESALWLRVDRTGAPAVGTALLSRDPAVSIAGLPAGTAANNFADQRDQLNRGDPANDARDFAGTFVAGPQANALRNIHFKIGPELRSLGLTTCSTEPAGGAANNAEVNVDTCVAQAAPAILPDVIVYDFAAPEGWPNGRTYDDPVADRLLAAALLQISGPGAPHNINSLLGVINTWNGPVGVACPTPCRNTGDETGDFSPAQFPYLRPAYPP